MKQFGLCSLVAALSFTLTTYIEMATAAETTRTAAPARAALTIATRGEPSGLRLASGMLTFCDKRGWRQLDLATGREADLNRACPSNDEPNIGCGGVGFDVDVQSPLSQPNDTLDLEGQFVLLKGRVHDCAAEGKVLAVATGSAVVLVNATQGTTHEISRQGGDRVAIGAGWVAWSSGAQLHAVAR